MGGYIKYSLKSSNAQHPDVYLYLIYYVTTDFRTDPKS
jgi:hypothetical protein